MIDYKEQVNDPRWVERSREIMKRDNFTCQLCGKSNTKLNVHHIKYIKGKDYWDYPEELLMTVCEVCHQKIHGKYNFKKTLTKNNTRNRDKSKNVIFKSLFTKDKFYGLSYNTQVVLSLLIWDAIKSNYSNTSEFWEKQRENKVNFSGEEYNVNLKAKFRGFNWIQKESNLPRSSVIAALKSLEDCDILEIDKKNSTMSINVYGELFDSGYIELFYPIKENSSYIDKKTNKEVKINSHDIIIYSYLKYKSNQKYKTGDRNGCIDTYISKLAIELSVCERDIKRYLARLKEFGLIERLNNGKLKIN